MNAKLKWIWGHQGLAFFICRQSLNQTEADFKGIELKKSSNHDELCCSGKLKFGLSSNCYSTEDNESRKCDKVDL